MSFAGSVARPRRPRCNNPRARAPCGASTAAASSASTAAAFGASTTAALVHQPPQHPVHQPPQHSAHQPPRIRRSTAAASSASAGQHQFAPQSAASAANATRQPLADFLVRKLNEVGATSRDDLRRLALQEGYFADSDSADRGMHNTLLNVVKAGLIRQLPNGNFAPATMLDTIRLRRAM